MPRRKKHGASLGMKRKGYWKSFPSMAGNNENNKNVINNDETMAAIDGYFNNPAPDLAQNNNEQNDNNDTNNDDKSVMSDNDDEVENVDETVQKKYFAKVYTNARRWTIFCLFVYKYDGLNPPDGDFYKSWSGRNGLATKIRQDVGIDQHSGLKLIPMFEHILEQFRTEHDFNPKDLETRGGQRPHLIKLDSPEAQIIADGIEGGLSINGTWQNVNQHRLEGGLELLSESAVVSTIRRLKPKLKRVKRRKQGSTGPNSPWSRARLEWTTQLLVRFGELGEDDFPRPIERRFKRAEIGHLDIYQVVWWDETHRKCLIGGLSRTKNYHIMFPRTSDGKVDTKNGEYSNKEISILNVKYEKECRMGLGCAMVTPLDDNNSPLPPEGRRCKLFNYTSKVLVSISDGKKMMATEIRRVKNCSSKTTKWIDKVAPQDKVYSNDPVDKLKKCGYQTKKKLLTVGIKQVQDLRDISDANNFTLPPGLARKTFQTVWQYAKEAEEQPRPLPIDHRKAANPYESKYGADWKKFIVKSPTFSNSVLITDYITHIMQESKRVMEGTKHQEDWKVYHDALSLMTAKETKEWMREEGFLDRWILPSSDLYNNLPILKSKYDNNPIGNSPEFMPWDAHLNADVHSSVDYHCLVAKDLSNNDPRKFESSTPKNMLKAYERLLDPGEDGVVPSSHRICQDIRRVIKAFKLVRDASGCIIDERNLRKGRRYEASDDRVSKRGGKRQKKCSSKYLPNNNELHKDLVEVRAAQLMKAAAMFDDSIPLSINNEEGNSENTVRNTENNNNEDLEAGSVLKKTTDRIYCWYIFVVHFTYLSKYSKSSVR